MLTLDNTTLFYWTLSNEHETKRQKQEHVLDWSLRVPLHSKPGSRPKSGTGDSKTKSRGSAALPSIFSGKSTDRTSRTSILTSALKITEVKAEQPEIVINDVGGLSDSNEVEGIERDAAMASPFKKGERATSSVSNIHYNVYTNANFIR